MAGCNELCRSEGTPPVARIASGGVFHGLVVSPHVMMTGTFLARGGLGIARKGSNVYHRKRTETPGRHSPATLQDRPSSTVCCYAGLVAMPDQKFGYRQTVSDRSHAPAIAGELGTWRFAQDWVDQPPAPPVARNMPICLGRCATRRVNVNTRASIRTRSTAARTELGPVWRRRSPQPHTMSHFTRRLTCRCSCQPTSAADQKAFGS